MNQIQKQIIETTDSKVYVDSAAASGKTHVLTERIRYLLNLGVAPEEIVAITFTNNAASVMYERLGKPQGLFIGTVHSYCNFLLMASGIDTSELLLNERFDDLFPLIQANPQCIRHISYLLVDEAMDSTEEQFEFFELLKPDNYMYFFDLRQAIYGWNGADPQYLIDQMETEDITVYHMKQNYRNYREILQYAKRFLFRLGPAYADDSISARGGSFGCVLEGDYTPAQAVEVFLRTHKQLGCDWRDWFILCRTNADVELFSILLNKQNVPNDTFKQAEFTNAEIEQKMKEDTVKILTVHSAKGLEAPNVLVYNVRAYKDEEARICYVAATRARDHLIWAKMPSKKKKKTKIVNWE